MKHTKIKLLIGSTCMMALLLSCKGRDMLNGDILLSNGWKVQSSKEVHLTSEELSSLHVSTQGWYEATVPSTVMGVLTANGLYTDALEGLNYKKIDKSLFDTAWWYRTEFVCPVLKRGQHASLLFDGISYAANIWLNGKQIASREELYGPFRRFRLDVTDLLGRNNVLAVEVFRAQPGEPNIGFVDWNPRPADESMGIFREVHLLVNGEVAMEHSAVRSKVNTETLDEAWLTVETHLTNQSDDAVDGELRGELDGTVFTFPVSLAAHERRVVTISSEQVEALHLKHPRLWWCHNMGKPEMYEMKLEFVAGRKVSDRETINFGVREVKDYLTEEGYRGFLLNGRKVLVRGAGWTDDIFLRDTPHTNEIQIQYVRDMNLNAIRFESIWGNSDNVYDLCDRYGLLALVGWSCHWEWETYLGIPCDEYGGINSEHDMRQAANSLNDQILWLRNHPSIITWFVGSDKMPRPELERLYKACLDKIDNRSYTISAKEMVSELSGPSGMKMAGPYEYVAPNYWYAKDAPGGAFGFNTETSIGAQLPCEESIRKMLPADKLWPLNEVWNYHCTASIEAMHNMEVLTKNITSHYGEAKNLSDYLLKADLLNYESTRAMFEAFRVNVPHATGIIQWMLNSAWPSLYWQLYDYYRVPTAAYYSVKKANRPQQLIYDYARRTVFAVNEGFESRSLHGRMFVYDLYGKQLINEEQTLTVAPYTVPEVFKLPTFPKNVFLVLQLLDKRGNLLTDNFYCLAAHDDVYNWSASTWYDTPLDRPADFRELSSELPSADCAVSAVYKQDENNSFVEVCLKNTSGTLAFFVRQSLKNKQGELLTPVFWDDNYLSLLPGETRVIRCRIPYSFSSPDDVVLTVSGWNIAEKSVPVLDNREITP